MDLLLQHLTGIPIQENVWNLAIGSSATDQSLDAAINALPNKTVRLVSDVDCYVVMIDPAVDSDVTATTGLRLIANQPEYFSCSKKKTTVSVIQSDTAGTLNIVVL